jgi:cytochrome b561
VSEVSRRPELAGSGRYPAIAILLHWTIAALIIAQVVLAGRMEGPRNFETFAVTQLHKSIGVTVLLLTLARIAWRLMNPPPPMPDTMKRWEKALAGATHVGFYAIMLGMPLTGWLMTSSSALGRPTILYGLIPWPNIPGVRGMEAVHETAELGHSALIKVFYVLIALHVAGALKHQLFSRDEPILARMAPGAKAGRWLEPRLLAILLGLIAVLAIARFAPPPDPGFRPAPAAVSPAAPPEPAEASDPKEEARGADRVGN